MKKIFSFFFAILLCSLLTSCSGGFSDLSESDTAVKADGSVELEYATQIEIVKVECDIFDVKITDGLNYCILPEDKEIPAWANNDYTIIKKPIDSVYMAASSAVNLVQAIDSIDKIKMTATKASDWGLPSIKEMVSSEEVQYVGKYNAPDYEAILFNECDLAKYRNTNDRT